MSKTNLPERKTGTELIAEIASQYRIVSFDEMEGLTIERTMFAETATQVLAAPESVSLDELTGEPFWLIGIDFFAQSQVKGREDDVYAYINCYWDNGSGFRATTGSPFVISRVHRLAMLGVLPRRVMSVLVESKRNQGQASLWIIEAPQRTTGLGEQVIETTGVNIVVPGLAEEEPF